MIEGPPDGDWHYELITPGLLQVERVVKRIHAGRTRYQYAEVLEGAAFGHSLVLDGKTQSTEADEFAYHEALVQPSMIAHPNPVDVFVAGGGEGATIREALSHKTVERVVMVDIDKEVVDLCRQYLPNHHRGSFDDPRLTLHFADAFAYLEQTDERFDVVIIDVPDPLEEGPAYLLFTREFYTLLRDRLKPGGVAVAQSAFVPAFASTWGFVISSLGPDPSALSPDEVDRRIGERISGELGYLDGIALRGMTSVPKYLREAVANERRIITRDNPLYVP